MIHLISAPENCVSQFKPEIFFLTSEPRYGFQRLWES